MKIGGKKGFWPLKRVLNRYFIGQIYFFLLAKNSIRIRLCRCFEILLATTCCYWYEHVVQKEGEMAKFGTRIRLNNRSFVRKDATSSRYTRSSHVEGQGETSLHKWVVGMYCGPITKLG